MMSQIYGKKVVLITELRPRLQWSSFYFFVLENPFCVLLHNEINAERVERWQKIKKRERKAGNVRQKKLKTNPLKLIPNSYLCKK